MIKLDKRHDELVVSFPEIGVGVQLTIRFQRTHRIPDDGRTYKPLPEIDQFPLEHVDDHLKKVPSKWLDKGGVMMPMYQGEGMWIEFESKEIPEHGRPFAFAVKIAAGKINGITGDELTESLDTTAQNYVVVPLQSRIDGFNVEQRVVRQFVAMPFGKGFSVEDQLREGPAFGGIQIMVYPMSWEAFVRQEDYVRLNDPERTWCTQNGRTQSVPATGLKWIEDQQVKLFLGLGLWLTCWFALNFILWLLLGVVLLGYLLWRTFLFKRDFSGEPVTAEQPSPASRDSACAAPSAMETIPSSPPPPMSCPPPMPASATMLDTPVIPAPPEPCAPLPAASRNPAPPQDQQPLPVEHVPQAPAEIIYPVDEMSDSGSQVIALSDSIAFGEAMLLTGDTFHHELSLAAGGRIEQQIFADTHSPTDWDKATNRGFFIHLASSEWWFALTGTIPPLKPLTAKEYNDAGLPWLETYEEKRVVDGSEKLRRTGGVPFLPDNDTFVINRVKKMRSELKETQIREASF